MIKPIIMRRARHVARMGKSLSAYTILVTKLEGKRQFIRRRHTWSIILKVILEKSGGRA